MFSSTWFIHKTYQDQNEVLSNCIDEPLLPKQTKVKVVTSSDGLSFFDRLEADCLAFREEGEQRKAKRKAESEAKAAEAAAKAKSAST